LGNFLFTTIHMHFPTLEILLNQWIQYMKTAHSTACLGYNALYAWT
jgi:hypothetical protein